MKLKKLERCIKSSNLIFIFFFMGFIGGMIVSFFMLENDKTEELLWLDTILLYIKYGEIKYGDMLFYILKQRITTLIIILILCMSGKKKYILTGAVGLAGGFAGYFITQFVVAKGILGSMLFFVTIFPHIFFYAYAYYCFLLTFYEDNNMNTIINRYSQNVTPSVESNRHVLLKKMMPFVVVIIGILLECYVNPFFLKLFLKIFM